MVLPQLPREGQGGSVQFENEILLAVSWLAGGTLLLLAAPLRRLRRLLWRWLRLVRRAAPKPFTGKAYVIDGDTIDVGQARVRLFGMDAPELSQWAVQGEIAYDLCSRAARRSAISRSTWTATAASSRASTCGGRISRSKWSWTASPRHDRLAPRLCRRGWQRGAAGGTLGDDPKGGIGDPAAHAARRRRRPGAPARVARGRAVIRRLADRFRSRRMSSREKSRSG